MQHFPIRCLVAHHVVNSTSFMLVAVHHAVCQTFVRAVPTYSSASYFGVPYLSSCPTFVGGSYSVQWRSRRVNLIVASCASCCPAPYLCFKVVEFCSAIMQHAIAVDKCDSLPCGSFLTFCCSGKQCFSCSCLPAVLSRALLCVGVRARPSHVRGLISSDALLVVGR